MFNREARHEQQGLAQLGTAIEPYRAVVIAYETDERLTALNSELLTQGRHVVNSNDRIQFSAANLVLASNRATMVDAIADGMLQQSGTEDLKGAQANYDVMSTFLVGGYQAAADCLEASGRIAAVKGFQGTPQEVGSLQSMLSGAGWPASDQITRRFLSGAVNGLRTISTNVNTQYRGMQQSKDLQNSMRIRLSRQVDPLRAALDAAQQGIDLIAKGRIEGVNSPNALADIYKSVIEASATADRLSLWLTVPRLLDASFTLTDPLDELRPQGKSFNASALGNPAVRQATTPPQPQAPAQPQGPSRPFQPGSLQPPAPHPSQSTPPRPSGKPFNPGSLASSSPASQAPAAPEHPKRSFSPDALGQSKEQRPFDPSHLGGPAVEQTVQQGEADEEEQPKRSKPFRPGDL